MNIVKTFSLIGVAAFGLSAVASAQTTKVEHPFKIELGAWFPTFSESGISKKTGITYALGYTFSKLTGDTPASFEVELRGSSYKVDAGGDDATVNLGQLLINANLHSEDGKLFYGIHVGAGKGELKANGVTYTDDDTRFIYGAQLGYNFNPQLYGVVRYTHASESPYKGITVGVGYRF